MKRFFFISVISLVIYLSLAWPTQAAELGINCSSNTQCQPQQQTGFFSWTNAAPGEYRSFKITLVNRSGQPKQAYFSLNPTDNNPTGGFQITIMDDQLTLFDGYLTQAITLNLGQLDGHTEKPLYITIKANSQVDNSWQGRSIRFDSNLYIESESAASANSTTPTPTPTPAPAINRLLGRLTNQGPTNLQQVLGQTNLDDILATRAGQVKTGWLKYWPARHPWIKWVGLAALLGLVGIRLRGRFRSR